MDYMFQLDEEDVKRAWYAGAELVGDAGVEDVPAKPYVEPADTPEPVAEPAEPAEPEGEKPAQSTRRGARTKGEGDE